MLPPLPVYLMQYFTLRVVESLNKQRVTDKTDLCVHYLLGFMKHTGYISGKEKFNRYTDNTNVKCDMAMKQGFSAFSNGWKKKGKPVDRTLAKKLSRCSCETGEGPASTSVKNQSAHLTTRSAHTETSVPHEVARHTRLGCPREWQRGQMSAVDTHTIRACLWLLTLWPAGLKLKIIALYLMILFFPQ